MKNTAKWIIVLFGIVGAFATGHITAHTPQSYVELGDDAVMHNAVLHNIGVRVVGSNVTVTNVTILNYDGLALVP